MRQLSYHEWLEWRMLGIGGSEAPIVKKASPWVTPEQLWKRKTRRAAPQEQTPAMRRGIKLEPKARLKYEEKTGVPMPPICLEHAELSHVRGTLDGWNPDARGALEIKCPGKEDHKEALLGRIPKHYVWQLVHILVLTGFEWVDYFSFDGVDGVIVRFERDKRLERDLLEAEAEFWKCVLKDTPPDVRAPEASVSRDPFKIRRSR